MTTLLARLLLIAFVAIASAQTCIICPNGEIPRNGNLVLYEDKSGFPVTCNDLVQYFMNGAGYCATFYVHAYQVVCGCPKAKAGSCPGICETGSILSKPQAITQPNGDTCLLVDQILRGAPGDLNCDTSYPKSGIGNYCPCKGKMAAHTPNNMDGGGNGGAGNQGMGTMSMSAGRQLRFGGLEEHFLPHAARGFAM